MLDDEFCRLYIVLSTCWREDGVISANWYRSLIVADWSHGMDRRPNHPGEIIEFGEGVEDDVCLCYVELPVTM